MIARAELNHRARKLGVQSSTNVFSMGMEAFAASISRTAKDPSFDPLSLTTFGVTAYCFLDRIKERLDDGFGMDKGPKGSAEPGLDLEGDEIGRDAVPAGQVEKSGKRPPNAV